MAATIASLPVLPTMQMPSSSSTSPAVGALPVVGGASPTGRLVVTPVHSPASLGLGSFMIQGPSPMHSRPVAANFPVVVTQMPAAAESSVCPSPKSAAICGDTPDTLATRVAPVVQTVRQAGQRVRETPCVALSLERVQGYTVAAKEAATNVAAQGVSAADDVGQTIEPYLNTALTKYCLPAYVTARDVHAGYVVPNVTMVRDTYNQQYHTQYVVPAVTKAGELIGQAQTTYMENYHHQYVVPSVNRTVEAVGQLPQRLTTSMTMQPQQPTSASGAEQPVVYQPQSPE